MARKKNTTSKPVGPQKDRHKPKLVTLADGSQVMQRYGNDNGVKRVYPDAKEDEESETGPKPKDAAAKLKYPPPKRNLIFRAKWMAMIRNLTERENFKEAHLETLAILCDLYVEYAELEKIIRIEGRTFKSVTRWGESRHIHPATTQLDKVRANIRQYTQKLDLFPKKDTGGEADGEKEEWD